MGSAAGRIYRSRSQAWWSVYPSCDLHKFLCIWHQTFFCKGKNLFWKWGSHEDPMICSGNGRNSSGYVDRDVSLGCGFSAMGWRDQYDRWPFVGVLVEKCCFFPAPKTWRNSHPEIDRVCLPKTSRSTTTWKYRVQAGWKKNKSKKNPHSASMGIFVPWVCCWDSPEHLLLKLLRLWHLCRVFFFPPKSRGAFGIHVRFESVHPG